MAYVPLHVHSEYSLLDGANRLPDLVKRARALGMSALALTDHGNLHGAIEFAHQCQREGMKALLGCELYVAPGSRFERSSRHGLSDAAFHLILIAKDVEGWQNLMALSSKGYLEGFYYRPRVDKELLAKHSKGLICLSGCLSGEVATLLDRNELPLAQQVVAEYQDIFGKENYYLECQDHGLEAQKRVNAALKILSAESGAPLVATPDCHYLRREDAPAHDVLLCVQTAAKVDDPKRMRFDGEEFYLKSEAEMRALFAWAPEAIDNTVRIADACHLDLGLGKPRLRLPAFTPPPESGAKDEITYLRMLCAQAMPRLYPKADAESAARLEYELGVIDTLGYAGYFLVVRDIIHAARQRGVRVGPGRGSAAGSLVSYVLGITALDPIEHGLLFERFLNPERVSPPDIDIDFADNGRQKVLDYVVERYGRDHVAQVVAFGTLGARAAVRDVGRALDYSYGEVDTLAKLIPASPDMTLGKALAEAPELAAAAAEPRAARLLDIARSLEGLSRHASTHAAGVVISPQPLIEVCPLGSARNEDGGGVVTQWPMESLERVGLVKIDLLGLRTLSVVQGAVDLLSAQGVVLPDLDQLPDGDELVFGMLSKGDSHGVFQLESSGMRDLLRRFKPRRRADLDALIALFRPGPMAMIDDYLKRKDGLEQARYSLPMLEPILKETFGVIVYQEQVMRVAMEVAGFSAAQADLLRRAMGKKDLDLLERQRQVFLDGSKKRGVDPSKAEEVFDLLARFAQYGFNRAHSAAYASLAYQTAWLKAHYPGPFLAALLSTELGSQERVMAGMAEARRLGLKVLPPDVGSGDASFSMDGPAVRFGLAAVKHVGFGAIESLVAERERGGAFKNLDDLLGRVDSRLLNGRAIESLIKAGALDSLVGQGLGAQGRASLLARLPLAQEVAGRQQEERATGQTNLFGGMDEAGPDLASAPVDTVLAWTESERLAYEKEVLGFFLSGHPLDPALPWLRAYRAQGLGTLAALKDRQLVTVGGVILSVKHQMTKRGEPMARITLEDMDGVVEAILWPQVLERCRETVRPDALVLAIARLDLGDDQVRLSIEELWDARALAGIAKSLRVRLDASDSKRLESLAELLGKHPGKVPLILRLHGPHTDVTQKGDKLATAISLELMRALDELVGTENWRLEA